MLQFSDLEAWKESFRAFHARFAGIFKRDEPRQQAYKYMHGLFATVERKNGWHLAEAVGDKTPDSTQRLLYQAKWEADQARDINQEFIIENFSEPDGIGVIDETGFLN